jgi:hypothetical protein
LKKLVGGRARAKKKRENDRKVLLQLEAESPEIYAKLHKRSKPGRPRVEDDQPELLSTIVDIATYGGGAEERRRSDQIRTIKTLEDLTTELNDRGFMVYQFVLIFVKRLPFLHF